jgi:cob(I)alamin adenosyltransferase
MSSEGDSLDRPDEDLPPDARSGATGAGAAPVYTRSGDEGETGLRGGQRVKKSCLRVDAYGTIDELHATVGWAREIARQSATAAPGLSPLLESLIKVQHQLFNLGSTLASLPEDLPDEQPRITHREVEALEREMDRCSRALPPLTTFVLPGGCQLNAALHVARTVCRRAERRLVELAEHEPVDDSSLRYVNRLSDALFVWARWAAVELGAGEIPWNPDP